MLRICYNDLKSLEGPPHCLLARAADRSLWGYERRPVRAGSTTKVLFNSPQFIFASLPIVLIGFFLIGPVPQVDTPLPIGIIFAPDWQTGPAARFRWRPNAAWAIVVGCLFGVAVAGMISKPTTFLYFRL